MRTMTIMGIGLFSLLADVPTDAVVPGQDFITKALTQGGLLAVVMVLLYWQWSQQKQKDVLIAEMLRIAERSAIAAEANVQVTRANTDAVRDLTVAVRKS